MKTTEFEQRFTLDRTGKGLRGLRKGEHAYPVAVTADGRPFDHSAVYHFYDGQQVRDTSHLRRVDAESLGSMGLRIVEISKLRSTRDDALTDAQKVLLAEIDQRRERIREFEAEKTPAARTMKYVLMSN